MVDKLLRTSGIPCDNELFLSHLTVDVISFHSGISQEFSYEFSKDISTWIQQLCPSSLLEYFRYGSAFKGLHSYNPFHDDCCPFVEVVVGHVCLNASEIL